MSALESPTSPQSSPPPRGGEGALRAVLESVAVIRQRSRRVRTVAESEQELGHVMVVFAWGCHAASDPVEQVGIGTFEQRLVTIEPRLVEAGKMSFGEAAEQEVGLTCAAMPRAVQQPLAAVIGRVRHPTNLISLPKCPSPSQRFAPGSALSPQAGRGVCGGTAGTPSPCKRGEGWGEGL